MTDEPRRLSKNLHDHDFECALDPRWRTSLVLCDCWPLTCIVTRDELTVWASTRVSRV